jgi:hypothetical protein
VLVDPIKPKLKPPGTKHLKLNCDILLSASAFKFNLRRYTEVARQVLEVGRQVAEEHAALRAVGPAKILPTASSTRVMNPRVLNEMAAYDVARASNVSQALAVGGGGGTRGGAAGRGAGRRRRGARGGGRDSPQVPTQMPTRLICYE